MNSKLAIRTKQHLVIAIITALSLIVVYAIVPGTDQKYLWSMATAYTSLILLGIALSIGPLNIIRNRNNPASSDLRRDFGIWSAMVGFVHVVIGIQVHMGNFLLYFFKAVKGDDAFALRSDLFGGANYVSLLATFILFILFLLSNDISLKLFWPKCWKKIQQWSYVLFLLVAAHGIMFQIIENRLVAFILLLSCLVLVPIVFQGLGIIWVLKHKE